MALETPDVLNVCVTADICNAIFPEHRDKRRWDNIICEAIRFNETIVNIKDDFSSSPRVTWFVRADPMLERHFGSSTFLFERHGAHLSRLAAAGYEIGWHPHLDVRNLKNELKHLPEIAASVRRFFPVSSVRVGEAFHSNEILKIINNLGFTADSTALPGRYTMEARTPFDWQGTIEKPYKPAFDDYRKPDQKNESRVVEIPFTMLPIRLPHDKPGPSSRYMNLSYKRDLFEEGVMGKHDWNSPIVAITHPAELLPPRGYSEKHPLLSFNEEEPSRNLKFLFNRLRSLGFKIRYRCIREIPPLVEKEIDFRTYHQDRVRKKVAERIIL